MGIFYVNDSQNLSLDVLLRQIMMIVLVLYANMKFTRKAVD